MADDTSDDASAAGGTERPKRAPPTIDLDPSEVSGETQSKASGGPGARKWRGWGLRFRDDPWERLRHVMPALSGALAACLVLAIVWAAGWIAYYGATASAPSAASGLADRVARLEARPEPPPAAAPDNEMRGRVGQADAALAAARGDITALRKQIDQLMSDLNDLKSRPRGAETAPDLGALTERVSRLEQSVAALPSQMQSASTSAATTDATLSRLSVATVLEDRARRGLPLAEALAAAKQAGAATAMLAPLEPFAASGVPTDPALARDLVTLLPQLKPQAASPPPPSAQPSGTTSGQGGVLDRLLASGAGLVKIERAETSAPAASSSPSLAALEDAARRGDVVRARAELARQPDEIRSRAQRWIDAVEARDAAIKAASTFANDALAAVSGNRQ